MSNSYLSRKVSFTILNRKELPNNKRIDPLKKYGRLDAFDNDKAFWNEMTPKLESSRGHYSRYTPLTPMTWKHEDDNSDGLELIGNMKKYKLSEVTDEVRRLTKGVCVQNGFVDLNKIHWPTEEEIVAMYQQEQEQIAKENAKNNKAKMISSKKSSGKADSKLVVKK